MAELIALLAQHGLFAVFIGVLVEQLGLPIPSLPLLFLAGVAGADDSLFALESVVVATIAAMFANSLWYFAGFKFGRRAIKLICRLSLSPDSCVRSSEDRFERRGVLTLVISKFIPGLAMLAPPLSGALGMPVSSFLAFNLLGTVLWAGGGVYLGAIFHEQLGQLPRALEGMGDTSIIVVGSLLVTYIALRGWRRHQAGQKEAKFPRIQPQELAKRLKQSNVQVIDVRGVLTKLSGTHSIPDALHIDLRTLEGALPPSLNKGSDALIVTYCSFPNDLSAAKAALILKQRGYNVLVLAGGVEAWLGAGYNTQNCDAR